MGLPISRRHTNPLVSLQDLATHLPIPSGGLVLITAQLSLLNVYCETRHKMSTINGEAGSALNTSISLFVCSSLRSMIPWRK